MPGLGDLLIGIKECRKSGPVNLNVLEHIYHNPNILFIVRNDFSFCFLIALLLGDFMPPAIELAGTATYPWLSSRLMEREMWSVQLSALRYRDRILGTCGQLEPEAPRQEAG